MNKKIQYPFIIASVAIPIILYFYFLKLQTTTIYGDDLAIFESYQRANTFLQKICIELAVNKFRPLHGLLLSAAITFFKKKLVYYYLFNILIQSINTLIFARILNLFLKSPWMSILFSLMPGLSRFSFYNVSQLFNGGLLEGLAMTFFLLSLYYIIKALVDDGQPSLQRQKALLMSLLLANITIYIHERYIVLFAFIVLVIIFSPALKTLSLRQKTTLCAYAILSIIINVAIKRFIFSIPFFVGTGGTNIAVSFKSVSTFFADGLLSICQINSKPDYLTGLPFSSLSASDKTMHLAVLLILIAIFLFYFTAIAIALFSKKKGALYTLPVFITLGALFIFTIIPGLVTIRLEQRWLQAPFAVFILMTAIALDNLPLMNIWIRGIICVCFIALFQFSDYNYLFKGYENIYLSHAQHDAAIFKKAIDENVISSNTQTIYCRAKQWDINRENEIKWAIQDGDIFDFYQNKSKKLIFADSVYQRIINPADTTFRYFAKTKNQVIDIKDGIIDITNQFLNDSLKNYSSL